MKGLGRKPSSLAIGQDEYVATVLLITGRDQHGRPRECRILHGDEAVKFKGREEFLIVYAIPRNLTASKN